MYVSGYLREIDFGAFLDVPASCVPRSRPVVKVFGDGRIQLYGEMRKRAAERHSFRARISPDGRYFALYPEPTGNIRFRADGSSLHHEKLAWLLREKQIQIPAVYEMEWFEQENAWVGCCSDLPVPDMAAIRRRAKRVCRRTEQ